ncbi:MAG TPA: hypothetical protein VNE61_14240 [Ktedonobacteraceae bacterium]|nr:hypothetical protein [Ktedonobacteraceae bacterium]
MQNRDLSDKQVDGNSFEQTLHEDTDGTTAPLPPPDMRVIRSAAPRATASINEAQLRETLSELYQPSMDWALEDEYAAAVLPFPSAATKGQSPSVPPLAFEAPLPALSPAARVQASPATKRYGAVIAMLGGFLELVAFFLPWFLVLSSCGGEMEVSPARPFLPLNALYLIIAVTSTLLGLAVYRHRGARQPLWASILHLVLTIIGLLNIPIMSLFMIGIATAVKATLIGFWAALIGCITSLCGSIWMIVDRDGQPRR